jgi:hypothetical protein
MRYLYKADHFYGHARVKGGRPKGDWANNPRKACMKLHDAFKNIDKDGTRYVPKVAYDGQRCWTYYANQQCLTENTFTPLEDYQNAPIQVFKAEQNSRRF